MARAFLAACLLPLVVLVAGCGSSRVGAPDDGPAPAGDTLTVGAFEVGVESAAGFRTLPLTSSGPVGFTAMYGTNIVRLQELGRGGKIAYWGHDGNDPEIYVMSADGSGQTKLTKNVALDASPDWSPDGSKIAFVSDRPGHKQIYVMNADGTGQTRLSKTSVGHWEPDWSPDGSKIAYRAFDGDDHEIYAMNPDGSGEVKLTNNSVLDKQPDWSPDGRRIAYAGHDGDDFEIYVMNAGGGGQTNVSDTATHEYHPAWSPDGKRIAFHGYDGVDHEIYVMNADGSGRTVLTDNSVTDTEPAWSPDGREIAYKAVGGSYEIYKMNADGSGVTPLTMDSQPDGEPAWCPTPSVKRTLIGGPGTDGPADPPLGSSRPLAVVAHTDSGLLSAATVKMHSSQWAALKVAALNNYSTTMTALKLTGPEIRGVIEDMGRGFPPLVWDVKQTPATGAVLVFFSVNTGKVTTVIASADEPLDAAASGQVLLTGHFTEAYSAADPSRNLITGSASELILDDSGAVVAVH